uniref:Putative secreted protein n=1 Tax=Anopheles darlingi TaxID=43151 RepID=A0A2M4DGS1_ANODA
MVQLWGNRTVVTLAAILRPVAATRTWLRAMWLARRYPSPPTIRRSKRQRTKSLSLLPPVEEVWEGIPLSPPRGQPVRASSSITSSQT